MKASEMISFKNVLLQDFQLRLSSPADLLRDGLFQKHATAGGRSYPFDDLPEGAVVMLCVRGE